MGATYTRQSSFTDGDVITADLFNNEYDQLLAAFASSTGHTHDGTAGEGGPLANMLGHSITFGAGTAGSDVVITFDGETNDGVLKWMEDEDYFEFSDDILIATNEKIQFRDTAIYIHSSADATLDIISDGAINLTAGTDVVIPVNVGITFGTGEKIEGDNTDLTVTSGADINLTATADINIPADVGLTFGDDGEKIEGDGTDLTIAGNNINLTAVADVVIPANVGLTFGTGEKIEGDSTDLTVTSGAKINLAATSDVHLANNIGMVFGDAGEKIEGDGTNLAINSSGDVNITATTVDLDGKLEVSGTLTQTGIATFTDDIIIGDGKTIGSASDVDAITIAANGQLTLTQTLIGTALDISGDIDIDGTTNLDIVDIDGAVDMATTLAVAGNVDFNGDLDVDGTTNLDIVDIDGAVNMATTALVTGVLTTTAATVHTNGITMPDSAKAIFGGGDDLQIFYDGSNAFINNTVAGALSIKSDDINLMSSDSENMASFVENGAVKLYHDNAKKFETSASGVTVLGNIANGSGDMALDVAGDIILDAGGAEIIFKDAGTQIGRIRNVSSGEFTFQSDVSDKDIVFNGNDGGSTVTALTLDMSDAGTAIFNHDAQFPDGTQVRLGADNDMKLHLDGTTAIFGAQNGDMLLDSAADIILDADGADIIFKDAGTQIGSISLAGSNVILSSAVSDEDMIFKGNDGGSTITALTLDMSAAGAATFNSQVTADNYTVAAGGVYTTAAGNDLNLVAPDGRSIFFKEASTTHATIDNSGNFIVGEANTGAVSNGQGAYLGSNGQLYASSSSSHFINKQADGDILFFRSAGASEGVISIDGSTTTYTGFSGRHESSGIPTNTPVGTVVSTIDALDVYPDRTTDTDDNAIDHLKAGQTRADHAKVKVSDTSGDACVYGVVANFNDDGKLIVTSVGIGSVRVTGACSKGDLLESNGDGTAIVQSDDIVRSKTLGKVTIGNSNTGVKLVSCVMYCG